MFLTIIILTISFLQFYLFFSWYFFIYILMDVVVEILTTNIL